MTEKRFTFTDIQAGIYEELFSYSEQDPSHPAYGCQITKKRLCGGPSDGVDIVKVNNGHLAFEALPTRGMGLWKAWCGGVEIGWSSPVKRPVHPSLVPLTQPDGLGWLEGFGELLCRCGLESNGAPEFDAKGQLVYPLHGRIANRPAYCVEATVNNESGELSLTGDVDEARLFFNKMWLHSTIRTQPGSSSLTILDTVTNLSAEPGELELLYHINFGIPFLTPGARVLLPLAKLAPRDADAQKDLNTWNIYGPETPGSREVVFFTELAADSQGNTRVLLRNAEGNRAISLRMNRHQLPYFILWKNRLAAADGYVTGLEPALNFPNVKSFEKKRGRVAILQPGESRIFEITLEVHEGAEAVASAEKAVAQLQAGSTPAILDHPDPAWSPV
ncbi:MAG TPA: aldose 1-epimerase family protein [Candidatus Sumerlaeota bacterium]|nr:aldose 1-epimerase family protein [Candidatus Sumerlaeota bacterium]HPS02048.1 aldose 1-epimerase family protein [Candidatus Sumerlaeota bacterium]